MTPTTHDDPMPCNPLFGRPGTVPAFHVPRPNPPLFRHLFHRPWNVQKILDSRPNLWYNKISGGNRATGQQRRLEMSNFHNEHVMQFYRHNLKTKGVFGK